MGFTLERDEETGPLNTKQPLLINRAIISVGIDGSISKVNYTPARYLYLVKNEDGVPVSDIFKYSGVV